MSQTIRSLLLAAGFGLLALSAQAQEFKVGVVDTKRILRESAPAKTATVRLEAEFSKREKDLAKDGASLKDAVEKFQKELPTMAEATRNTREKQLGEQDREFQRKRREFQDDLGSRRSEELQAVQDKSMKVIKQLADTGKYDLILQEAVYFNPKYDITDQVIKGLNAAK